MSYRHGTKFTDELKELESKLRDKDKKVFNKIDWSVFEHNPRIKIILERRLGHYDGTAWTLIKIAQLFDRKIEEKDMEYEFPHLSTSRIWQMYVRSLWVISRQFKSNLKKMEI